MNKRTLGFLALVVASAVMVTSLFSDVVVGPAPNPPMAFDVNVQNTPLPVEVTNPSDMPIATNCTTAWRNVGGSGSDIGHAMYSGSEYVFIGDRTVVFTGGSVTGHVVFSSENSEGHVPAAGKIQIATTSEIIEIALPFNSVYRVEHVTEFLVVVNAFHPRLPGSAAWSLDMKASAFWFIED